MSRFCVKLLIFLSFSVRAFEVWERALKEIAIRVVGLQRTIDWLTGTFDT